MWKRITLLLWALFLLMIPATVAGASDIGVSAQGIISAGLNNFTIIYVSNTELDFTWTYGLGITGIMIRGKYGRFPANILSENETPSDGYLVYSGNETWASDTSVDFDQNAGPVYYRAWAQRADGTWVMTPSQGSKESKALVLLIIGLIALGLTVSSFWLKQIVLAVGSAFAWLLMGAYGYITAAGSESSIYFYVFFFGIAMTITMAVEAVLIERGAHKEASYTSAEREFQRKERAEPKVAPMHPMDKVRARHGMAPSEARERRKLNNRTGW